MAPIDRRRCAGPASGPALTSFLFVFFPPFLPSRAAARGPTIPDPPCQRTIINRRLVYVAPRGFRLLYVPTYALKVPNFRLVSDRRINCYSHISLSPLFTSFLASNFWFDSFSIINSVCERNDQLGFYIGSRRSVESREVERFGRSRWLGTFHQRIVPSSPRFINMPRP